MIADDARAAASIPTTADAAISGQRDSPDSSDTRPA
jgi:hypothetical protein